MKITFESSLMMPSLSDAFSMLTNGAKICLNDINHDVTQGIVEILMTRNELVSCRKSILGVVKPSYSKKIVTSSLKIRQVVNVDIRVDDRLVTECDSRFTAILGVQVNGNEMHFASAEEISGTVLCHVFITVKEFDLELVDRI